MNILVIRLSAIGDIFLATALLGGLRSRYPGCRITWLTEPMGASILQDHPAIDRLLTLPRGQWVTAFREGRWGGLAGSLRRFLKDLRAVPFDLVIDPQGLLKSAIWARSARARRRIGLHGREGSRFLYDQVIRVPQLREPPILFDYRLLLEALGGQGDTLAMDLRVSAEQRAAAEAFLGAHGAPAPVVFCPFTTRPQKHWVDGEWARLGDALQAGGLGPVVLLGGPDDGARARAIAERMRAAPVIAAGERRPIGFALAVLARASGVVGVDTGLTHAAIAFKRPTVALFGSTRLYVKTGLPWARVLYHELPCAPCHRRPTCDGRFDCMRRHTAAGVEAVLREMMDLT